MLVELAIGDAYGAGFEYVDKKLVLEHNDLSAYFDYPRHDLGNGRYTDDTQMTLAVTEVLLSGQDWTKENLAAAFVDCFKRDPRVGYAGRFYQFLVEVKDADDFLARIQPGSDKSGAAMRATTIGAVKEIAQVKEMARLQANITHDTEGGINSAIAAALATHYFIYRLGDKSGLPAFLDKHVPGDWTREHQGPVGQTGMESVRAAVTAIMRNQSMSDLLKDCIAFTGDVDTVATIALGAASHSLEVAQDLPVHLIVGLEDGPYGRSYLAAMDRRLAELISANRQAESADLLS